MLAGVESGMTVGKVSVSTTSGRGRTPEEVAHSCVKHIISISENANPILREQAEAFRNDVYRVLVHYMKQAVQSDRTTIYNALCDAGRKDLAEAIRRL